MPGAGVVFLSLSFSPPVSLVMVSKPAGQEAVKSDGFTYGLFDSHLYFILTVFIVMHQNMKATFNLAINLILMN